MKIVRQGATLAAKVHNMNWSPELQNYHVHLRKRIAQGRGIGSGRNYRPWHTGTGTRTRGTAASPSGIVTGRQHELLSDYETLYFFLLERNPHVIDIREQFPILDLSATLRLCKKYGWPHKRDRYGLDPYSIDFLVTERPLNGTSLVIRATTVKPEDDLELPENKVKLAIEFDWCNENAIPYEAADFSEIENIQHSLSVCRFMRAWLLRDYQPNPVFQSIFLKHFYYHYERNVTLAELISRLKRPLRCSDELCLLAFRHAAWRREIDVSLNHVLALNYPVVIHSA